MQTRWLPADESPSASAHWERVLDSDRKCALNLNGSLAAPYEKFWLAVDRVGDVWTWIAVMLAIGCFGGALGRLCALHMFLAGLCAFICYRLVKNRACRVRPCANVHGIRRCAEPLDEWSFPSGHVLHATAFSTVAMAYYPVLALVCLPFLMLLGVSRIVLGLHYPSDVIAGAAIGAAIAVTSVAF